MTTNETTLASVAEMDRFIDDPAHTSATIEDMVRDGKTSTEIATTVRGWITTAVTTDAGATYTVTDAALARFVRREVTIANARIACDAEDDGAEPDAMKEIETVAGVISDAVGVVLGEDYDVEVLAAKIVDALRSVRS